ncbi:MAG: hypothetical protein Q8P44_09695 [Dehalococcoidia bacterium]|nr:hypothetical protein [Dehalococcoidia bacterium]
MEVKRYASAGILPHGADPDVEAEKHPAMVNEFTHWSSPGMVNDKPAVLLTFDPDCPRCKEFKAGKAE